MTKALIIGEVLVEIMATTIGNGFDEMQSLIGPFPSGAPAIFADQMAKMGHTVALVSCVGDDAFGRLNINRLITDGVDISGIGIDPDRPTGSAFVRYRNDGSRDFIFNINYSACGQVNKYADIKRSVADCTHIHIMGSSLSTPEFVKLNIQAAQEIKAKGGTVSFDPNVRKEMLASGDLNSTLSMVLSMTDLFLPSGEEITLLTLAKEPELAIQELLALGVKAIAHKKGVAGCRYISKETDINLPAFKVDEVDPTGAGDSFGGAFITHWLANKRPHECLEIAAAAGALAVTRRGPMEGTSSYEQIKSFVASHSN